MHHYAQINALSVCVAVSSLSAQVAHPRLIPIASPDETLIGKKWTGSAWIVV